MNETMTRTAISLPFSEFEAGKKQAEREGRNFSSYVRTLIRRDLEKAGTAAATHGDPVETTMEGGK